MSLPTLVKVLMVLAVAAPGSAVPPDSLLRQAPRVIDVPADQLPEPELLASPEVRVLLGYTRQLLRLHDGHTLGVFSYSTGAPANWLFLIDTRDLSSQRYPIPNNDGASHGSVLGKDGDIYTMPYRNGRIYRFDTQTRVFKTIDVDVPKGEATWEPLAAASGKIYFGTYPNACLGEYDPATQQCTLFKQIAPNTKYVTNFSEDADGTITCRAWGPDEVWMRFDPNIRALDKTEKPKPLAAAPGSAWPAPPEGDSGFNGRVEVDGRRFAISYPSGRFWEVISESPSPGSTAPSSQPALRLKLLGDTGDPAVPSWWLESAAGAVVGISYFGQTIRYDLKMGRFERRELENRCAGGNAIMFIESVTPHCVIGGHYSQQNLFRLDPQTRQVEYAPGMIARVTGEPMCAIGIGGRAYIGIYVQALISLYDPAQPFAFGTNPRELIDLGTKYQQVRPRDAATDGQRVYISSDGNYNLLGGALSVIDPATDKIEVYHELIREQNLPTLAYDPKTRFLWGGTDRWGQMHSHPPTQPTSLIYAFDPPGRRVVARLTPFEGADETKVLGVSSNGILIASVDPPSKSLGLGPTSKSPVRTRIALIDTVSQEILYRGDSPLANLRKIRCGADGLCYFVAADRLYRWDGSANTFTSVARAPGCRHLTESSPGTWLLASDTSIYRVQLRDRSDRQLWHCAHPAGNSRIRGDHDE